MIITDLTNTSWVFKNTVNYPSSTITYSINFKTTSSSNYDQIEFRSNGIRYKTAGTSTYIWASYYQGFENSGQAITITGGTDATNDVLISYLLVNAYLVTGMDVSDTYWVFNDYVRSNFPGQGSDSQVTSTFNINFTSNNISYASLSITYYKSSGEDESYMNYGNTNVYAKYEGGDPEWFGSYKVIHITDGADITDRNLIGFLLTRATLLNTSWVIKENPSYTSDFTKHIDFTSDNTNYNWFDIEYEMGIGITYGNGPNSTLAYYSGIWNNTAYRIISITGGIDLFDETFTAWLKENATQVPVIDLCETIWFAGTTVLPSSSNAYVTYHMKASIDNDSITDVFAPAAQKTYDNVSCNALIARVDDAEYYYVQRASDGKWGIYDEDHERWVDNFTKNSLSFTFADDTYPSAITDRSNPDLIAWLAQNLTFLGSPYNLKGTTWFLNKSLGETMPGGNYFDVSNDISEYYSVNFTSNGSNFNEISFHDDDAKDLAPGNCNMVYGNTGVWKYLNSSWEDQAYRTITITGGADATNAKLVAWLQENAVQVISLSEKSSFSDIKLNNNTLIVNGISIDLDASDSSSASVTNNSSFKGISAIDNGDGTITLIIDDVKKKFNKYTESYNNIHITHLYAPGAGDYGYAYYYLNDGQKTELEINTSTTLNNVEKLVVELDDPWGAGGISIGTTSEASDIYSVRSSIDPVDITDYLIDGCYVTLYTSY